MSVDKINACTTEGHKNIEDENHLGEEIISNNKQSLIPGRNKVKIMFLYHNEILL